MKTKEMVTINISDVINILAIIGTFCIAIYEMRKNTENQNKIYRPYIQLKALSMKIPKRLPDGFYVMNIKGVKIDNVSKYEALNLFIEIKVKIILGEKNFEREEYYFFDNFYSNSPIELSLPLIENDINSRLDEEFEKILNLCNDKNKLIDYISNCTYMRDGDKENIQNEIKDKNLNTLNKKILSNRIEHYITLYLKDNIKVEIENATLNLNTIQGESLEIKFKDDYLLQTSCMNKELPLDKIKKKREEKN